MIKDKLSLQTFFFVTGALVLGSLGSQGCSSDPEQPDRVNQGTGDGGTSSSGGGDGSTTPPDPNNNRNDTKDSCFAACSNLAFLCRSGKAKNTKAELASSQDGTGCEGQLQDENGQNGRTMKIVCTENKVCVADAPGGAATNCVPGLYNAVSFEYKQADGDKNICTRDNN